MKFKIGDKVQLKSGGPVMTMTHVKEGDDVTCCWFQNGEMREYYFPENALKLFEDPKGLA